jgi:hypothetical protein
MIAVFLAILIVTAVGIPLAIVIHPSADPSTRLGEGFLFGAGWTTFVMLALSLVHVRWTFASIILAITVPLLALAPLLARLRVVTPTERRASQATWISRAVDLLTILLVAGYAFYVTLGPLWEWDFWAIFGVKARVFLENGGIDWGFLRSPYNLYANVDYPLMLPLLFDFSSILNKGWDERWIGLLYPAFTAALLLIVRPLVRRETESETITSVATLMFAGLSFTETAGTGEAPLIAASGAAMLLARRALLDDDAIALRAAAVLLGVAAWTKNEGVAMIAAAAIAIAITTRSWRKALALWPAAVIAAPWIALVRIFALRSAYLQTESMSHRIQAHVLQLREIGFALASNPPAKPLLWIAAIALLLMTQTSIGTQSSGAGKDTPRERFLLCFLAIQLVLYLAAYLVTAHPVVWQIHNSWPRLLSQLAVPFAFAALASGVRLSTRDRVP